MAGPCYHCGVAGAPGWCLLTQWPLNSHILYLIRAPKSWEPKRISRRSNFLFPFWQLITWSCDRLDVRRLYRFTFEFFVIWSPCLPSSSFLNLYPREFTVIIRITFVVWGSERCASILRHINVAFRLASVDLKLPLILHFLAESHWELGAKWFFCKLIISMLNTVFPVWTWIDGTHNLWVLALQRNGSCFQM